jgi:hypothetical protein
MLIHAQNSFFTFLASSFLSFTFALLGFVVPKSFSVKRECFCCDPLGYFDFIDVVAIREDITDAFNAVV